MTRQSPAPTLPAILLTRPAEQGDRFAAALRARFGDSLRCVAAPMLVPRYFAPALPQTPVDALIFTSETGVAAFARLSADPVLARITRAWCVGDRTAKAARDCGLTAISAKGDADALLEAIVAAGETGPLLHLRGAEVRGDLAGMLTARGIPTDQAVVYAQESAALTPDALHLLRQGAPVVVPLFSPRSASLFTAAAQQAGTSAPLWVAALSPTVAEAAGGLQPARMVTAGRPDSDAMQEAVALLIAAGGGA
ncbi:uroporphyrinogen-III synthase [Paracoccaceae bacterium Fryx2]|nr:uroporphyrinogen-III synthase [Paracoccaceae bacterium Fryx2]